MLISSQDSRNPLLVLVFCFSSHKDEYCFPSVDTYPNKSHTGKTGFEKEHCWSLAVEEPGQCQNVRMETEEAKFALTWEVRKTAWREMQWDC